MNKIVSLDQLEILASRVIPHKGSRLSAGRNPLAQAGQIWTTRAVGSDGKPLQMEQEPVLALVLDRDSRQKKVLRMAPIIPETEKAGPEDVLLPGSLLGWRAVLCVGSSIPVQEACLDECRGLLPLSWMKNVNAFYRWIQGVGRKPAGLITGMGYIDERDIRVAFHKQIQERMVYLKAPGQSEQAKSRALAALRKASATASSSISSHVIP